MWAAENEEDKKVIKSEKKWKKVEKKWKNQFQEESQAFFTLILVPMNSSKLITRNFRFNSVFLTKIGKKPV